MFGSIVKLQETSVVAAQRVGWIFKSSAYFARTNAGFLNLAAINSIKARQDYLKCANGPALRAR
jgi:hypothetical protein